MVPGGAGHIMARTVGQSTAINTKEKSTHSTPSCSAKLIIHFKHLKQQDECVMQPLFSFSEWRARHTGELVPSAARGCLQSHRFARREIPFSMTTAYTFFIIFNHTYLCKRVTFEIFHLCIHT